MWIEGKIKEMIGISSDCGTNKTICLNSKGGRGGVKGLQPSLQNRVYDINGISTAITTAPFFMPNFLITP